MLSLILLLMFIFLYSFYSIVVASIIFYLHAPTADFSYFSTDVGVAITCFQFCTVKNARAWKSVALETT